MNINTDFKTQLPEEFSLNEILFKKVPGFVNTYADSTGKISLLNSKGQFVKPSIQQWSTTKGTYIYAKVISDEFIPVMKAVHQLVCLSFHGSHPTDGRIYEPNHKNGNKHDNSPSNLEWTTRSANVQHAFDSGLCQAGLRVEAVNKVTGETKSYNSLSKMSREWDIPRHQLRTILANHRELPYQGEWIFIVDDSKDKKLNRHQSRSIVAKDYVTGVLTIYSTAIDAAHATGVNQATIALRVRKKCNNLLSKYIFKELEDKTEWPQYTLSDAIISEQKYLNKSI